jgi:choline kinase
MIALILAAGTAMRLRPLTNNLPKILLEINGRKIIDMQLETLIQEGIHRVVVVTGYKSETLEKYLLETYKQVSFVFIKNHEFERSSAAYSVGLALPHISEPCIYLNGDVVYQPEILKNIITSSHQSITAIKKNIWDEEQVNVIVTKKNKVISIGKNIEENESAGEFIGVTKLSLSFITKMREIVTNEGIESIRYQFAVDLVNKTIGTFGEELYILDVSNYQAIEIDTEADLIEARKQFKSIIQ